MDRIYIDRLEVFARHGVYEEEQKLGQKFLISAVLELDLRKPGTTDSLENTVNYGAAAKKIAKFASEQQFLLIERLAEGLAKELLCAWPQIRKVTVRVDKPWAPIGLPLDTAGVSVERGWHTAYIGLGSNLGDRGAYLDRAVEELDKNPDIFVEKKTDWLVTAPYGVTDQPDFLNGCVRIRTILDPEELLDVMQSIEKEAGRVRTLHWGPRTLDLDLLFYDDEIIGTERLVVPHPEIEKRYFVLAPMAELAPWLRHPVSKKTMRQLLDEQTEMERMQDERTRYGQPLDEQTEKDNHGRTEF